LLKFLTPRRGEGDWKSQEGRKKKKIQTTDEHGITRIKKQTKSIWTGEFVTYPIFFHP
jgi:hypothetical protein